MDESNPVDILSLQNDINRSNRSDDNLERFESMGVFEKTPIRDGANSQRANDLAT